MVEEESPLNLLAGQILELEAQRHAVEETLNRTPGWRFRRRAMLERRLQRRREQEHDLIAFAAKVAEEFNRSPRSSR